MKSINKISLLVLVVILGLASSCKKIDDFGDINTNPGSTTAPITAALLTNVLSNMPGNVQGPGLRGGLYCQYMSETQYTEISLYSTPQLNVDGVYSGILMDLQNIINSNKEEATREIVSVSGSNNNQIAIARILKAYYFWILTDQFGDLPYSEALSGNPQPKYDTQEFIYKDLLKELKEAAAQFDEGAPMKGDILLGGNKTRWRQFALSVRLLISLRMSKVDPNFAKAQFNEALTESGVNRALLINSNADNITMQLPGGNFKNPWFNLYNGRKDQAVSSVLTGMLSSLNDPRINAYASSSVGFPYGLTRDQAVAFGAANPNWGKILSDSWRAENSPVALLTYSQILFARSEAAERGWTSEDKVQLYKDAIKSSMEQWNVFSTATYNNYLTNSAVDLSTGNALEKIATQRWIALYPNCNEGWAEWRRTGYPALTPSPNASNSSKQIPRRFTYGVNEYSLNETNVRAAATRIQGGDTQDGRVWWDKQ
jgi:Starch-binding associating with outer membrane